MTYYYQLPQQACGQSPFRHLSDPIAIFTFALQLAAITYGAVELNLGHLLLLDLRQEYR